MKFFNRGFGKPATLFAGFSMLAALFQGCSFKGRMSTMDPAGPLAKMQMDLFMVTVYVTLFIFVVVGGVLLYAVVKYRERPGDDRPMPSQGHGNPLIEVSLIGSSVFLLVIIAIPTLKGIWMQETTPMQPSSMLSAWYPGELEGDDGDDILRVKVKGWQWWWSFEYPQLGVTTANELVIPAGKTVHLELRAVDVIHSFWLPRIAGKVDLIPGRTNSMWIQAGESLEDWSALPENADLKGDALSRAYTDYLRNEIIDYYYGQCAEYCGDSHARMLFRADVVDNDAFAAWVGEQKAGHPAPDGGDWADWYARYDNNPDALTGTLNEGAKLFVGRGKCIACHQVKGNPRALGVAGPNLTMVGARASIAAGWMNHRNEDGSIDLAQQHENLTQWIYRTDEIKPGNLMWVANGSGIGELENPLSEAESAALATYLQSLK